MNRFKLLALQYLIAELDTLLTGIPLDHSLWRIRQSDMNLEAFANGSDSYVLSDNFIEVRATDMGTPALYIPAGLPIGSQSKALISLWNDIDDCLVSLHSDIPQHED